ncbi:hypothetical protein [Saccharicrinis fermentans]|nr:hypothetical protein [Saccharicrinis fermentans]
MKLFKYFLIVSLFTSCITVKDGVNVYFFKKIDVTTSDCRKQYFYKGEPLNGNYIIKSKRFFCRGYSNQHFKDGFDNGKKTHYYKGLMKYQYTYKNGLLDGEQIDYYDGEKWQLTTRRNGLLWGDTWYYTNNRIDTTITAKIYTDKDKMDTYASSVFQLHHYKNIPLGLGLFNNECLLKAPVFEQNFYLQKDSTLVYKKTWIRSKDGHYYLEKEEEF